MGGCELSVLAFPADCIILPIPGIGAAFSWSLPGMKMVLTAREVVENGLSPFLVLAPV